MVIDPRHNAVLRVWWIAFLAAALALALTALPDGLPRLAAAPTLDREEIGALNQVNQERAARGLPALDLSISLQNAAAWHSADMAARDILSHTDSLGRSIRPRFDSFGYPSFSSIRENVAFGTSSGVTVTAMWMNSSGHRANILAPDVVAVGIARAQTAPGSPWYWTLDFGSVLNDTDRLPDPAPTVSPSRWSLVGWLGAPTAVPIALQPFDGAYGAIFGWIPRPAGFRTYASDLPDGLNSLTELLPGAAYWVRLSGQEFGAWPPPGGLEAADILLDAGFNLVAWWGPDGTTLRDAVETLGDALLGAWAWEFGAQRFRIHLPLLPDGLNDDFILYRGDGLWVRLSEPLVWRQGAP